MERERIATIFKALCDENRVLIMELLQEGPSCACDIGEKLGIAQSKLSYHMKKLCDGGLVECWYQGKWTHYKISEEGSIIAINILKELTAVRIDKSCNCQKGGN